MSDIAPPAPTSRASAGPFQAFERAHPLSAASMLREIAKLPKCPAEADQLLTLQKCHDYSKQISSAHEKYNRFGLTAAYYDAQGLLPRGVFIGDVQGELELLVRLIHLLEQQGELTPSARVGAPINEGDAGNKSNQGSPATPDHPQNSHSPPRDTVVLLGDMISRGPDSAGVIDYILHYLRPHYHCLLIMGNAEARILNMDTHIDALPPKDLSVIQSYQPKGDPVTEAIRADTLGTRFDFLQKLYALGHQDFFASLTPCTRLGPYILSHSGDPPYAVWDAQTTIDAAIQTAIRADAARFYHNNGNAKQYPTLSLFGADTMKRYYSYDRHHQALGFSIIFGHISVKYPRPIYHEGALQALALDTDVNGMVDWQRHKHRQKVLTGFLPHKQQTVSILEARGLPPEPAPSPGMKHTFAYNLSENVSPKPIPQHIIDDSDEVSRQIRANISRATSGLNRT